jgi:N-sulfoglucosamine sulfohydrolase
MFRFPISSPVVRLFLVATGCFSLTEGHGADAVRRPNILIAVADDWSFPHAGIYGTSWVKTPNFDRIAREGVLFSQAYTPVAKCSASRACILTGRQPWQLEAGFTHWNFFPPHYRTYPEILLAAGYFTGFTGKGWAPGIALTAEGAPRTVLGRSFESRKTKPPTSSISNIDYAANFTDFLAAAPQGQPWCFWYGGNEPHRPYEFQSGVNKAGKLLTDLPKVPGYWPDNDDVRHDMLDYALEVEYFDSHLGRILAELERRGELDNTLIIVTGDNGMPFPRSKGQCYEIANHLPLAVRWPAGIARPGRTVTDFVSFADLGPTLLAATGAHTDTTALGMTGRSFLTLLQSEQNGRVDPSRDHVLIGRERHDPGRPHNQGYPVRGIVTDDFLYLRNFAADRWPSGNPETGYLDTDTSPTKSSILSARRLKGEDPYWNLAFGKRPDDELYDLNEDPDCVDNLAGQIAFAARRHTLEERLLSELRQQGDPRLVGSNPDIFDTYPFSNPSLNDLYERYQSGKSPLPTWCIPSDVDANLK